MLKGNKKSIICLDFDGTVHLYLQGWTSVDHIADGPVPGAMQFIVKAQDYFDVAIFSGRSLDPKGIEAMQKWLLRELKSAHGPDRGREAFEKVLWPTEKPPARLTIDDRAIQFAGVWPSIHYLVNFRPWNDRMKLKKRAG